MSYPKVLFDAYYFSFFDDGTMGHSDGVGYCGETDKKEVYELYLVLKEFFEKEKDENE